MYTVLNEEEKSQFVNKYFKEWGNDIYKVSKITYKNITEYLINEHYIFQVKES